MARQQKPHWHVHVRGVQREPLEADLVAQIVLMLGRQLSQEAMTDVARAGSSDKLISDKEAGS
ncbi:MAG: hypothetical protein LC775_03110 [Acidobacteria bacterium]|nr:hypothetical protein [Acidobacteriota bacterium]